MYQMTSHIIVSINIPIPESLVLVTSSPVEIVTIIVTGIPLGSKVMTSSLLIQWGVFLHSSLLQYSGKYPYGIVASIPGLFLGIRLFISY